MANLRMRDRMIKQEKSLNYNVKMRGTYVEESRNETEGYYDGTKY